ncbi:MAG: hypothetical protein IPO72_01165 [Saprospiraceae bacterium]|nr:hypothetical protein [Candidatus Vicinibacter affinis]
MKQWFLESVRYFYYLPSTQFEHFDNYFSLICPTEYCSGIISESELLPTAVLYEPDSLENNAPNPTAVFTFPFILPNMLVDPIAVFPNPSKFALKEFVPMATLVYPVSFANKVVPNADDREKRNRSLTFLYWNTRPKYQMQNCLIQLY